MPGEPNTDVPRVGRLGARPSRCVAAGETCAEVEQFIREAMQNVGVRVLSAAVRNRYQRRGFSSATARNAASQRGIIPRARSDSD